MVTVLKLSKSQLRKKLVKQMISTLLHEGHTLVIVKPKRAA